MIISHLTRLHKDVKEKMGIIWLLFDVILILLKLPRSLCNFLPCLSVNQSYELL